MSPETLRLLARRYMGLATSEDYVEWATAMLAAGNDSPALCILAGLSGPLVWSEVESYFQTVMEELGWPLLDYETLMRRYACSIARRVMDGRMTAVAGADEIYWIAQELGYPSDLEKWPVLADRLDPITYRPLRGAELTTAVLQEARELVKHEPPRPAKE